MVAPGLRNLAGLSRSICDFRSFGFGIGYGGWWLPCCMLPRGLGIIIPGLGMGAEVSRTRHCHHCPSLAYFSHHILSWRFQVPLPCDENKKKASAQTIFLTHHGFWCETAVAVVFFGSGRYQIDWRGSQWPQWMVITSWTSAELAVLEWFWKLRSIVSNWGLSLYIQYWYVLIIINIYPLDFGFFVV